MILQDINVQFFPCKICGAKFPSYYFVHKHKKLWHEGEEDPSEVETETKEVKEKVEEEENEKVSPATH